MKFLFRFVTEKLATKIKLLFAGLEKTIAEAEAKAKAKEKMESHGNIPSVHHENVGGGANETIDGQIQEEGAAGNETIEGQGDASAGQGANVGEGAEGKTGQEGGGQTTHGLTNREEGSIDASAGNETIGEGEGADASAGNETIGEAEGADASAGNETIKGEGSATGKTGALLGENGADANEYCVHILLSHIGKSIVC